MEGVQSMLVPSINRTPRLILVNPPKLSLLLVSDSAERLRTLEASINKTDFEIKTAGSFEELRHLCHEEHDIVVLDVSPSDIMTMLELIRMSGGYEKVPVFVESTQINNVNSLAGVLPSYRAMPCNRTEILTLLRYYKETSDRSHARRGVL
jgi:DNA-binding NtrC family response regulator